MVLVATQDVKTAVLASSKISQRTQHAMGVPSDTATSCSAPPVATLSHPDLTVGTEKYASANLDFFVRERMRIKQRARLDDTHLCQDPLIALTARLVSTRR